MKFQRTSEPASEPVTLSEAKNHLRVTQSSEETYITNLITASREIVEKHLNRGLITQTWKLYLDEFPMSDRIELYRAPLQSVTSIKYNDEDGNEQTFAASNYIVDNVLEPGMIRLTDDGSWPDSRGVLNDVIIEYVVGYADADSVPDDIKHQLKLVLTSLFEHRDDMPRAKMTAEKRLNALNRIYYV